MLSLFAIATLGVGCMNRQSGNLNPQNTKAAEENFDAKITAKNLERKCSTEASAEFARQRLIGYAWEAHWNSKLGICLLDSSGWDTELAGVWNDMLWDIGNDVDYGTLSIKNNMVAAGIQNKSENPATNGTVTTCVLKNDVKCSGVKEWSDYKTLLMTE